MKRINQRGNEANDKMISFMKPAAMVHATGCNEQRNWLQWAMKPIAFLRQISSAFHHHLIYPPLLISLGTHLQLQYTAFG